MNIKFLKLQWYNTVFTIFILCLPILRERVQLPEGGYIIERYRPIVLLGVYIWLKDFKPFLLMIGFTLFIFFISSAAIEIIDKAIRAGYKK